ncbi:unnamed protein product, partial [marine sediment metagenome]
NLPEILKINGVDVVFIGPVDLSQSLNHPWNSKHPEVQKVIKYIIETTDQAGKIPG